MIRVSEIALPFNHKPHMLRLAILRRLAISKDDLLKFNIIRKSLDARNRNFIFSIYTVDVSVKDEQFLLSKFSSDTKITPAPSMEYQFPAVEKSFFKFRPVVIGTGPCGLLAGLLLARCGLKPILLKRGKCVDARIKDVRQFWQSGKLNPESSAQFGCGGAGTFSDGKLTTQIRDKHNRLRKVLEEFVSAGAPKEILYQAKPHIGTDNLVNVVKNICTTIESLGGEIRFSSKLTDLQISNGRLTGLVIDDNDNDNASEFIETDTALLAVGHSARDTFAMLKNSGVAMTAKPFSFGLRVEHPQSFIDKSRYGKFAGDKRLGSADYKLVSHCSNGRSCYTFCMCPGGAVIGCSSEPDMVVTNGMSSYLRNSPNANSALLVGITPEDFGSDDALAGIEFQRKWERRAFVLGGSNYFAPAQLLGDFLSDCASTSLGSVQPSYQPGIQLCNLSDCLPPFVSETLRLAITQMNKKLRGFSMADAVLTAVESRSSSPVRLLRSEDFQSISVKGLYLAGEGAGYSGGITSSAVDGIKAAESILIR